MISVVCVSASALPVMNIVRIDNSEKVIRSLLFLMFLLFQFGVHPGILVIRTTRACENQVLRLICLTITAKEKRADIHSLLFSTLAIS